MNVQIRPESADKPELLEMLKYSVTNMIKTLYANGIILQDNSVKIWIKEFNGHRYFPKIEFDANGQELQYDMTNDGMIREVHFKSFIHQQGKTKRHDINKQNAHSLLQEIDDILRFSNHGFTNEE